MNEPAVSPGAAIPNRAGILLVNLGTPEAATAAAVRAYLREFLSDPRVIEKQNGLWKFILNGIILPFRPRIKARAYRKVWNTERDESPLKTITRNQAEKLAQLFGDRSDVLVDWAMRYGFPSIASRFESMVRAGCDRILVVPLYPQYSAATTATVADEVFRVMMKMRAQPALRIAQPYYNDAVYIDALASSLTAALSAAIAPPEVILASFHGMPREYVDKGDPYYTQCEITTQLLRERLGLDDQKLMMTFQSRFGRTEWLQPYTDKTVEALAKRGVKNIAIITPGFSADCLETLEEIAIENAHIFRKAGGKGFTVVPCLNDSAGGMATISSIVGQELRGWV
jgi:ferrochelatase